MTEQFDIQKVLDVMFDPIASQIIAELETSEKEMSYLENAVSLNEAEILEKLSYLLKFGFIIKKIMNEKIYLSADGQKLASIVENSQSFDGAIDGLTKIDSYLN